MSSAGHLKIFAIDLKACKEADHVHQWWHDPCHDDVCELLHLEPPNHSQAPQCMVDRLACWRCILRILRSQKGTSCYEHQASCCHACWRTKRPQMISSEAHTAQSTALLTKSFAAQGFCSQHHIIVLLALSMRSPSVCHLLWVPQLM